MEFTDRVVEHLLVPARSNFPSLSTYSPFEAGATTNGGTLIRLNDEIVEFIEYAWAAYVGTGGEIACPSNWLLEPTVSDYVVIPESESNSEATFALDDDAKVTSNQLAAVKAAFGLSISQLAGVLRVKRPTIYAWLDSENGPGALRTSNRERLSALSICADIWNHSSAVPPGKYLTAILKDGTTLLGLLCESKLNQERIAVAIRTLIRSSKGANEPSLTEMLRKKGFADVPSSPTLPRRSKS